MHLERYTLTQQNSRDIAQLLPQLPFFSEKRLVIISCEDIDQKTLDACDVFAIFLDQAPPEVIVVFSI
jgi:DNA polymerase III delta subunit